jgi:hypothetical protein
LNPLSILAEEALESREGCLKRDDWSWQTAGSKGEGLTDFNQHYDDYEITENVK